MSGINKLTKKGATSPLLLLFIHYLSRTIVIQKPNTVPINQTKIKKEEWFQLMRISIINYICINYQIITSSHYPISFLGVAKYNWNGINAGTQLDVL